MGNEWIEWNGGECPVERGTLIDAKFRNGEETYHAKAGFRYDDGGSNENYCTTDWDHLGTDEDIVAYRLSE